jgi:histidine decarboxylase
MSHTDISTTIASVKTHLQTFIGYPLNASYDYTNIISSLETNLNNVGCPYTDSTVGIHTKNIERQVLAFFADLWGLSHENVWGYITSAGTEGNMQGLYVGRQYLQHKKETPIFYTSKDSHYSIFKIANILCLDTVIIDSQETGEMDYKTFEKHLMSNIHRPALINANIGTTMKSAIDDTREIYRILKKHNKHNDYYIHADGALMGFVLPFLEHDLFFKKHIHSISISGHKFLGIPFPCGIFLMEKHLKDSISTPVEYIGSLDCTISGSRNGHSPLFFYHIIQSKGMAGFQADIQRCIELAEYLTETLPNAWRNQNSLTVIFPKPSEHLIAKWHLATHEDISHAIVMPHVTKEIIDDFIADMLLG